MLLPMEKGKGLGHPCSLAFFKMTKTIIKKCAECDNEQQAIKGGMASSICRKCGSRNLWRLDFFRNDKIIDTLQE